MLPFKSKSFQASVCILVLMLVFLCSCGRQTPSETSSDVPNAAQAAHPGAEIVHIALNDSPSIYTASPTGIYSIRQIRPGSYNLFYADAATRQETYLCASPNCTHSSEECTSYVSMEKGLYGFTLGFYKDHLYLFQNATTDEYLPYLMQLDPDGNNRKIIASLKEGENFIGNVYGYENTILCEISGVSEDDVPYRTLIQIDLDTGERRELIPDPQSDTSFTLMGASQRELVYLAAGANGNQYFTVDPFCGEVSLEEAQTTKAITELFDGNDLIYTVQQDYLCKYDRVKNELSYQDLNTKEKKSFSSPEPSEQDTLYGLVHLFDDHFALTLEDAAGNAFYELIDSQTGALTGVRINISAQEQWLILGQVGEDLIYLEREEEKVLQDQGDYGLVEESTILPVYQIVSKTDFQKGKAGASFQRVYE